jgi:alpha-galactosidase
MGDLCSFACLMSLIGLAGCGIQLVGTRISSPPSALAHKPTKLVTMGNSITLHLPSASIGWNGSWGMAASGQAKDYSHATAAGMSVPVTPTNIAGVELSQSELSEGLQTVAAAGVTSSTVVVIEFGDNVPNSGSGQLDFGASYGKLLDAIPPHLKLVCTSTFWERSSVDAIIKQECESHGGLYTYIGNIYTDPNNPDRTDNEYSDPAVNRHPHDWGMAQISARILAEVNPGN